MKREREPTEPPRGLRRRMRSHPGTGRRMARKGAIA